MTDLPITGGCGCGAVRYEVDAPFDYAVYCHCHRCQKRTGAAAAPSAVIAPGSLRIVSGAEHIRIWEPGGGWGKAFCGQCGSALWAQHPDDGEQRAVRLGTIDGDPGIRPSLHQWTDSAAPWEPIPDDGLPRHPGPRPELMPRAIGINHIALEVGSIDEAIDFYGRILDFGLRSRSHGMAFLDMGDQFLALAAGRTQPPDDERHFGLVVDDKQAVREALIANGVEILPGRGLDFRDPWGNRFQIVQYDEIQFTKADAVARGMGIDATKTDAAREELRRKGLAAD